MKNIYRGVFLCALLAAVSMASPIASADMVINGQVMTNVGVPTNLGSAMGPSYGRFYVQISDPTTGQARNVEINSFDPVANVPANLFIAHITSSKYTVDVQRFIDPSTNTACYYSEVGGAVIEVNCVPITKK